MRAKSITLTIDSNLEDVFLIGVAVHKFCSIIPLSAVESSQMELCVVEAVNNAIKHAYGNKTGYKVAVIFTLYADKLTLDICDTGKPLEQKYLERKNRLDFHPCDRSRIPESGRGLVIIRKIMDKIDYHTQCGENRLTLTKWFGAGKIKECSN